MGALSTIHHQGEEIIVVDYSDGKEDEMIQLVNDARDLIVAGDKNVRLLSIFNHRNYITPTFMRHLENELRESEHQIDRNAVIGLSPVQKWILKGLNAWYKKQVHYFDTKEGALHFLTEKNTEQDL